MLHQGNNHFDRLDPVLVCDKVLPASFFAVLLLLGLLSTLDASEAIFLEVCFVLAIPKNNLKMKSVPTHGRNIVALCDHRPELTNILPRRRATNYNHTISK